MEEHGEGGIIEQTRKSHPQLAYQYLQPKAEPCGEGWYIVSMKVRLTEDGKPRIIPEKDILVEHLKALSTISAWAVEEMRMAGRIE